MIEIEDSLEDGTKSEIFAMLSKETNFVKERLFKILYVLEKRKCPRAVLTL